MGIGDVRPPFLRTSSTRLLTPHWFQFFTGFGMSFPRTWIVQRPDSSPSKMYRTYKISKVAF